MLPTTLSSTQTNIALLALGLIAFFILHSFLASLFVKQKVENASPLIVKYYRLFYNLLALVLFFPLYFMLRTYPGPTLWAWDYPYSILADALAVCAIFAFMWTLKGYDMMEFLGIRQLSSKKVSAHDQGAMHISTLHRYVRHPWYTLILVVLWTRDIHLAQLVAYSLITLYFVLGSRLEEKKLIVYYGEAYKQYMKKVPGIIPLPGRNLNKQEADELIALAATAIFHQNQSV